MKNNAKGITLIALVITIIVLLILAGVAIATLTGDNGILGKANNAKIENEKAEIKEMLSLAVNTIAIEQGQKQDSLSNYYEDKETFIENGKLDTQKYKVNDYQYDGENKIVTITMYKENGTKNQYEYEINLKTGSIEFKNKGEIVDPNKANKISYETNGGSFAEGTNIVTEYKKGDIVGFISPEKEGAAFDGWYLNSNFDGESINKTTKDMNGDITVYAKWVEETDSNYFTYNGSTITGFSDAGKEAFKEGKVKTLVIPKKHGETEINAIGSSAFENCSTDKNTNKIDIEKLVLQDNVTLLNSYSFSNCKSLTDLTIPISLDACYSAGNSEAFGYCTGLTKVKFTKGTGEGCNYKSSSHPYYDCTPWYISRENKINIELEEGITSIGSHMFDSCTGLQNISIPSTVTSIGEYAYDYCSEMAGELNINNVTNIGKKAFRGCTKITGTLNIPQGVTQIEESTFEGLSISKLVIHDNVTLLSSYSFSNCKSLTDLTIPISLDACYSAGNSEAFGYCTGLTKVKFTKGTGEGCNYKSSSHPYYDCTPWYISRENKINIELEEGITSIGSHMFDSCTGLQNISIPSTVTSIGEFAYDYCSEMAGELNTINNVTQIGQKAFRGCTKITGTLNIPQGVTQIEESTFEGLSISKLVIHDNVTLLSSYSFSNCKSLTDLTIPISLDACYSAGNSEAFGYCTGLTKVKFTKGTGEGCNYKSSSHPYYDCTPWYISRNNEMSIILENGISSIGNYTFYSLGNASFYYTGTQEQWDAITKNANNTSINKVTCNYKE